MLAEMIVVPVRLSDVVISVAAKAGSSKGPGGSIGDAVDGKGGNSIY
jgi:hypothetical protein